MLALLFQMALKAVFFAMFNKMLLSKQKCVRKRKTMNFSSRCLSICHTWLCCSVVVVVAVVADPILLHPFPTIDPPPTKMKVFVKFLTVLLLLLQLFFLFLLFLFQRLQFNSELFFPRERFQRTNEVPRSSSRL